MHHNHRDRTANDNDLPSGKGFGSYHAVKARTKERAVQREVLQVFKANGYDAAIADDVVFPPAV